MSQPTQTTPSPIDWSLPGTWTQLFLGIVTLITILHPFGWANQINALVPAAATVCAGIYAIVAVHGHHQVMKSVAVATAAQKTTEDVTVEQSTQ